MTEAINESLKFKDLRCRSCGKNVKLCSYNDAGVVASRDRQVQVDLLNRQVRVTCPICMTVHAIEFEEKEEKIYLIAR